MQSRLSSQSSLHYLWHITVTLYISGKLDASVTHFLVIVVTCHVCTLCIQATESEEDTDSAVIRTSACMPTARVQYPVMPGMVYLVGLHIGDCVSLMNWRIMLMSVPSLFALVVTALAVTALAVTALAVTALAVTALAVTALAVTALAVTALAVTALAVTALRERLAWCKYYDRLTTPGR